VSHELFRGGDALIEDKIVCKGDDLAERRRQLLQQADLILVLPGGFSCRLFYLFTF
jgi:predicted Rossmann-fold nucleotide-binding protein